MPPKQVRWTANCKAARILLEMLESKEITGQEKPQIVQAKNNEFAKFTPDTFRKRYRETVDSHSAKLYGKELFKRLTLAKLLSFRKFADNGEDDASMHSVPEFAGMIPKCSKLEYDVPSNSSYAHNERDNSSEKRNVQAISYAYEDPDTNNEFVVAAVILHGMSAEQGQIRRKLIEEDGEQYLAVAESWQPELLDGKRLFKEEPDLLSYHPKVVALKEALKKVRQHYSEIPEEIVRVKLAKKVLEDMATWNEHVEKLPSGNVLLRITFKTIPSMYSIDQCKEFVKLPSN